MAEDYKSYEYLYEQYVVNERSTKSIAEEHNTYPNTIRRLLKKHGFRIRDKSQAQKTYVKKHGSPNLGRKLTDEEKERISLGLQNYWQGMEKKEREEVKQEMSERAVEQWNSKSSMEKTETIYKMHMASKDKVAMGSKNENMVADMLIERGYRVLTRTNTVVPGCRFEIDIALPDLRIAVEWDGASHFLPIYGEEHLVRVQDKDAVKNRELTYAGWHVIRCRDRSTDHSKAFCRRAVDAILEAIEKIDQGGKPKTIYLDVE